MMLVREKGWKLKNWIARNNCGQFHLLLVSLRVRVLHGFICKVKVRGFSDKPGSLKYSLCYVSSPVRNHRFMEKVSGFFNFTTKFAYKRHICYRELKKRKKKLQHSNTRTVTAPPIGQQSKFDWFTLHTTQCTGIKKIFTHFARVRCVYFLFSWNLKYLFWVLTFSSDQWILSNIKDFATVDW